MEKEFVFDERLNEFHCARCNECCKQPGYVYISQEEAEHIAKFMAMDIYQFTGRYCDLLDRRRLVLKKKNGEECIFLNDSGCTIHEAKPGQCKTFPVLWRTARSFSYCEGLKQLAVSSHAKN